MQIQFDPIHLKFKLLLELCECIVRAYACDLFCVKPNMLRGAVVDRFVGATHFKGKRT